MGAGTETSSMIQEVQALQMQDKVARSARKAKQLPPWMQDERVDGSQSARSNNMMPNKENVKELEQNIFEATKIEREDSKVSIAIKREEESFIWNTAGKEVKDDKNIEKFEGFKRKLEAEMATMKLNESIDSFHQ